jgi:hypothetical protein
VASGLERVKQEKCNTKWKKYKWKINMKLILKNSSIAKGANKQITELSR